jgi:hypothetical protein
LVVGSCSCSVENCAFEFGKGRVEDGERATNKSSVELINSID